MKPILIILVIVVVALFTGTWIFGSLEWVFNNLGSVCNFLKRIFNLFGWNKGIL